MKRMIVYFLSFFFITNLAFAETVFLDNQTSYPSQTPKSKIAVQWATSAQEVQESNEASIRGNQLKQGTLFPVTQSGKVTLNVPNKVMYFRVIVWSKGGGDPDFLTNWVDVVPNKTYVLKTDNLIPSVLILGAGC
jgi:hypothetical protein